MTTTTKTKTTTKTLAALALAAAALTVMVGPSEAAPRLGAGLTGVHVAGSFHQMPPKISCFACNLPHGGQGGARPPGYGNHWPYHGPGYGWSYGNYWPYHGWGYGYGSHWPYHGWGYGYDSHWPYHGWGYGYGSHWPYYGYGYGYGYPWGYGYSRWYRWHPMYGGAPVAPIAAAPVAAAPVAAAPVATAAPSAPIAGPNCLTRQMLPNGTELLQDVCTQQSAVAQPQALSAR